MANAQLQTKCNVTTEVYHSKGLPGDWASKTRKEKLQYLHDQDPIHVFRDANTTCVGLHEEVVDHIDTNQSNSADASHLAVGDDDSSFSKSDTSLNNETNRFSVTSTTDNGATLKTQTFIDTSEANGETLKEVGLITANTGGTLLNHSEISDVVKDNNKTVNITVELTIQAV